MPCIFGDLTRALLAAVVFTLLANTGAQGGDRVDSIRERGRLRCGVEPGYPGFAATDAKQGYKGFDVDICRAIAAALLGDGRLTDFIPSGTLASFRSSNIDVVSRRLSWSLVREQAGVSFGPVVFYDGATLMLPRGSAVQAPAELDGKPICVLGGSNPESSVLRYFLQHHLTPSIKAFGTAARVQQAFYSGQCAAWSADLSELAAVRAVREPQAPRSRLLPQLLSHEPLAVVVRQRDVRLLNVIRWTVYLLIQAEERGVGESNVKALWRAGTLDDVLEIQPGGIAALGLISAWDYHVLRSVGNYAEIYARNLGPGTPVDIDRGLNRLWSDGGLLYAPRLQ